VAGLERKKIRKMGATTWFRPGEKIRFRVFCVCPKFLSLKNLFSVNFSHLLDIWDVHLYRKSLHVLFKEILQ
jgi:hypothetical protein